MNKRHILAALALTAGLTLQATEPENRIGRNLDIITDVIRAVDALYVDTLNYDELTRVAVSAMLYTIDPYTSYYGDIDSDDYEDAVFGAYAGVGSTIQKRKDGSVIFASLREGMPAQRAGIRSGDVIMDIDGKSTQGMSVSDVSKRLRGKAGEHVNITVRREGYKKPLTFNIVRQTIRTEVIPYTAVVDDKVGFVSFTEFSDGSARQLRDSIRQLVEQRGVDRLIVDLRNNGGGHLGEAVQLLSYFIPQGSLVCTTRGRDPRNNHTYRTTTAPLWPDMPLVVIVDDHTASASEIVSGTLQDMDRAVVVGERTFGKGLVQTSVPLRHKGVLKVTTAKYYIPSGRCIQAIDYGQRDEEGRPKQVPDSLTHEYKTAGGRIVRDGRGILPDIQPSDTTTYGISFQLYRDNLFFDYSVHYAATHEAPLSPQNFELADSTINDFIDYVKAQHFHYTPSSYDAFKELKDVMHYESLDSLAAAEIAALEARLKPTIEDAVARDIDNVRRYLAYEIAERYYYYKGVMATYLRYDPNFKEALRIITDDNERRRILSPR